MQTYNFLISTLKLLTLLIGVSLYGCAMYPVIQAAGGAMTGYDALVLADEYLPRKGVEGGQYLPQWDIQLERRLRERLSLNRITKISAHVINRQAYLVGLFLNKQYGEKALSIASNVDGLTSIRCSFYRGGSPSQSQKDALHKTRIRKILDQSDILVGLDIRIEVVRDNAILIGKCQNIEQKQTIIKLVKPLKEIKNIVDYITVQQTNEDTLPPLQERTSAPCHLNDSPPQEYCLGNLFPIRYSRAS